MIGLLVVTLFFAVTVCQAFAQGQISGFGEPQVLDDPEIGLQELNDVLNNTSNESMTP